MKEDFTQYDIKPTGFLNYLRYYGEHFNKKLCEFACKQLKIKDYSKDNLESLFLTHNITMPEVTIYDLSYIANWCKKNFYNTSISDEKHLLLFIKDVFDKESNLVFNRWIADMAKQGITIEWESMI